MGTISFSVATAPLTTTISKNIADADATTLAEFLVKRYAQDSEQVLTPADAVTRWATECISRLIAEIRRDATTKNVPPPIALT